MAYNVLQSMILQMVRDQWYSQEDAEKIATKRLQDLWYLNPWTMKLSELWKQKSEEDWNYRKIQRAAKSRWLPEYYFKIDMKWNAVINPLFAKYKK